MGAGFLEEGKCGNFARCEVGGSRCHTAGDSPDRVLKRKLKPGAKYDKNMTHLFLHRDTFHILGLTAGPIKNKVTLRGVFAEKTFNPKECKMEIPFWQPL